MTNGQSPIRILIIDDHPMVREGMALRISAEPEQNLEVCGEAATVEEALSLVKQTSPHLMIIDISLKVGHGLDLVKQIKSCYPKIRMLVISGYQESLYAERALRAGAMGYLNKQAFVLLSPVITSDARRARLLTGPTKPLDTSPASIRSPPLGR